MLKPPGIGLLIVCAIAGASPAAAASLTEIWRTAGFDGPESVSYDPKRNVLYVSNIVGSATAKDGSGYISQVDLDGKVVEKTWVKGLNAPKGTAVLGSALFVTDIDDLVEIHIPTRQVRSRFVTLDKAMFLNDPAVTGDERLIALQDEHPSVYVSDSVTNRIWLMDGGALSVWYDHPGTLAAPNGLVVMDDKLIVAELGDGSGGAGTVKQIDLKTKTLSLFSIPGEIGALDGIEPNGRGGVTVTDGRGGRLLELMPGQPAAEIGAIEAGSADHEWIPELKLFVVPNPKTGEVVAYRLTD
jgi:hypothetical protein